MMDSSLHTLAAQAMERAYAPYSRFRVGAALETADGRRFAGCNVENASYPVTMCAERVAIGAAVASGAREFVRLALANSSARPIAPCGMCRQALAEFGTDLTISSEAVSGERAEWTLAALLPDAFELDAERSGVGGDA